MFKTIVLLHILEETVIRETFSGVFNIYSPKEQHLFVQMIYSVDQLNLC